MTLAMVAGMPTMVRSRFSTPTIGRDWMIGELGEARTDIAPEGIITLRDAPWRARTNRATPIRKDEPARVVAIEGLVLEVEPEEGARLTSGAARPASEIDRRTPASATCGLHTASRCYETATTLLMQVRRPPPAPGFLVFVGAAMVRLEGGVCAAQR
jgi:hypothetical protein